MKCRGHLRRISQALDEGRPLDPPTQGHVDRCSRCRRFHERGQTLAERLRLAAALAPAPATGPAQTAWCRRIRAGSPVGAALVASLALGIILLRPVPPVPPSEPLASEVPRTDRLLELPATAATLAGRMERIEEDAVQREWAALETRARTTTDTLLTYLPTKPRSQR